jgi:predicted transglutaminase-like cysteine proteinase
LSEVATHWGEHHLILVVRTSAGDLVLELTPQFRPWTRAPYSWVRMQTPKNPNYWASLGSRNV